MPDYQAGSASIRIGVDFRDFDKDLRSELEARHVELSVGIKPDLDSMRDLQGKLDALSRAEDLHVTVQVRASTVNATQQMERWRAEQDLSSIRQRVELETSSADRSAAKAKDDLKKSFGELKGSIPLNLGSLALDGAPGVVASLLSVADAAAKASQALGLLPAVGFGIAAVFAGVKIGASGVGDAFKAMAAETKNATQIAQQHADAANAVSEAQYRVGEAQREVQTSQREMAADQQDLNTAYRESARSIRDMNDSLVDQKFATEDASLSVQEAAKRLSEVQHDPRADALQRQRAQLTYDEAVQRLKEQQNKTQDLQQDTARANQLGVEGSKQVVDAKQKIADAADREAKAQHDVTQANIELVKAQTALRNGGQSAAALSAAMAKLSPNAKELVNDVRSIGPAWTDLRTATSDSLFDKLGESVKTLADSQLPNLKTGLVGINSALNTGLRATMTELSSKSNQLDFRTFLDNTATGLQNMAGGAAPFTDAITKLVTVGSTFFPQFGTELAGVATRFDNLIQRTSADGSLHKWIQDGLTSAYELAQVFEHIGSMIASVSRAAADGGTGLKGLEEVTRHLADFMKSPHEQDSLRSFFATAREESAKWKPILADLPGLISGVYDGVRTWSAITMPFLQAAASLLSAHPGLVSDAVVAYLAFKTLGPIFDTVRGGIGRINSSLTGAVTGMRDVTNATNGVANIAGIGATNLGRFGSAVQEMGTHSPAIAGMQQAYLDAATGADRFGRTAGTAAAAASGVRTAASGITSALGGPWVIGIVAATATIAKVTSDLHAHEERVNAVNGAWHDLLKTRNELAGDVASGGDGISNVTDQVRQLDAAIKKSADNKTAWSDTRALLQAPWNDNISKENNVADQYDAARKAIEKLGISEATVGKAIADDGAWSDLKAELEGMGSGGEFAAKNYQWLRDELVRAKEVARDTTPGFSSLSTAVKTLADESATGADRLNAMKTALDILAGKPLAAQDALAKYNEQVRNTAQLAAQFDPTQGFGGQLVDGNKVDTTSANGKKLFDALNSIRDATLDAAIAGNALDPIFAKNETQFQQLATATGLSKDQIMQMATSLGYLPKDIQILARLQGANDVQQQLTVIGEELDKNREGITIPTKALTGDARAELEKLGIKVEEVVGHPDELHVVAKTDDALAKLQELIATKLPDKTQTVKVEYDLSGFHLDESSRQKLHENIDSIPIAGRAGGGDISGGVAGRDSVPIMAMPGEHMLTTSDVNKLGGQSGAYRFRAALQAGRVRGFADGGAVDESPKPANIGPDGNIVYPDQAGQGKQSPVGRDGALAAFAQSRDGQPYGGNEDCSGFISELSNVAVGLAPNSGRMSTANEGQWLSALGFVNGAGSGGTFRVGWVNDPSMPAGGHTAGTLPSGTNVESGGSTGKVMYGGAAIGANASLFTQHAYLVMGTGVGATQGAPSTQDSTTATTSSVINPQAPLPGRMSDAQITAESDRAAVDTANTERNAVYANPNSTAQDKQAADRKYQSSQNKLQSSSQKTDASAISVQGIAAKGATILANGLLSFFGLENSVFSDSNIYNRALNQTIDGLNAHGNGAAAGGYSYQPQNLPSVVTTVTPQSAAPVTDPANANAVPGAAPAAAAPVAYNPGGGVEQWRGPFTNILRALGKPTTWVDSGLQQMQFESGGDPNAVNDHDTDGHGGIQVVKGLMQELDATFQANRSAQFPGDIYNGPANIAASINYTAAKYGDAPSVWGHGHGYADGGPISGPGGPRSDVLPIWASNGEFMVNADAASRNMPLLESINSGSSWSRSSGVDWSSLGSSSRGQQPVSADHSINFHGDTHVMNNDHLVGELDRWNSMQSQGALAAY